MLTSSRKTSSLDVLLDSEHAVSQFNRLKVFVMRCAIWYHLYNLKNVKNTLRGISILVKLQAETQSRNAPHFIFYFKALSRSELKNVLLEIAQITRNSVETLQLHKIPTQGN